MWGRWSVTELDPTKERQKLARSLARAKTELQCKKVQDRIDCGLLESWLSQKEHELLTKGNSTRLRAIRAADAEMDEIRKMHKSLMDRLEAGKRRASAQRAHAAVEPKLVRVK